MCERSMLPMRRAFAEPAPINHTDHHRWRDLNGCYASRHVLEREHTDSRGAVLIAGVGAAAFALVTYVWY
jgi:hypothetical protein